MEISQINVVKEKPFSHGLRRGSTATPTKIQGSPYIYHKIRRFRDFSAIANQLTFWVSLFETSQVSISLEYPPFLSELGAF